jgi:hypothetical protein
MTEEMITLICEKCNCDYEKPAIFQKYLIETKHNVFYKYNVFYKWSLAFCDNCRREREKEALKSLHEVLKALGA